MITRFKIFENTNTELHISQEIYDKLIDSMSFLIYKGTKRNEKKHKNYKSLRIRKVTSAIYKDSPNDKMYTFDMIMTNNDSINISYTFNNDIHSSYNMMEINDFLIHESSWTHFENIDEFLMDIRTEYKKHLESKKWKIKE